VAGGGCVGKEITNQSYLQCQGWAIAHFENVRLLFFCAKKVQFGKLHIFCTFALFERQMCDRTFVYTFS